MADPREKRSDVCGCGCGCDSDDFVSGKTRVSTTVLRRTNNPNDLWVQKNSRSLKVQWLFSEEVKDEA